MKIYNLNTSDTVSSKIYIHIYLNSDLSELKDLESSSANILKDFDHFSKSGVTVSKIMFINNAGSLGPLTYIGKYNII